MLYLSIINNIIISIAPLFRDYTAIVIYDNKLRTAENNVHIIGIKLK